jgi:hypothetical protein
MSYNDELFVENIIPIRKFNYDEKYYMIINSKMSIGNHHRNLCYNCNEYSIGISGGYEFYDKNHIKDILCDCSKEYLYLVEIVIPFGILIYQNNHVYYSDCINVTNIEKIDFTITN